MRKFVYGKTKYKYHLDLQKRKTFSLSINPSMAIILKAPLDAGKKEVEKFLEKKAFWIDKQLNFFANFKKTRIKKEYVSGESFLYLGRRYMLKVHKSKEDRVVLRKGRLTILSSKPKNQQFNKELLDRWFNTRMNKIFVERLKEVLQKFDYKFVPEIKIRKMSKRWGSYHNNSKIIINPLLIHATKSQIDYVFIHELCHVEHKNHSKKFYGLLKRKCPKWELEKQQLENLIFNEF